MHIENLPLSPFIIIQIQNDYDVTEVMIEKIKKRFERVAHENRIHKKNLLHFI